MMKKIKIGIIGYGHVGKAMHKLFKNAYVYDKPKKIGSKTRINDCDIAFICVPTPCFKDGSCNTSIVENVISWCEAKCLVIRSTVRVGFTEEMNKKHKKKIVFQPEYYGETSNHPFSNLADRKWITLGGSKKDIDLVIKAYKSVMKTNIKIYKCSSKEAELTKYMSNTFLALKVTYCNEIYDLCKKLGIDYNNVRETWIADPRIGSSHTLVFKNNRGFGGGCFPKDLSALISQAKKVKSDITLLEAVKDKNQLYKK